MRNGLRWFGGVIGVLSLLPLHGRAADSPDSFLDTLNRELTVYGTVSRFSDSNLFRLPDNPQAYGIVLPAGHTRSDQFTDAGGGFDGEFTPGDQTISLQGLIDSVQYDHNTYLNHTSGLGQLTWDWKSGNTLSGDVSSTYGRSLAEFVNNRQFLKDIINQQTNSASVLWALAADLDLRLQADTRSVDHEAVIQHYQDNRKNSGTFSVEYTRGDIETFGLNYRQVKASFNDDVLSYSDKSTFGSYSYAFSSITQISAEGGYYQRTYMDTRVANFSGATGRVTVVWNATPITGITVNAFRNLGAYVNNESDYYVTDGVSTIFAWDATSTIAVNLTGTYERQNFRGSGIGVLATVRTDNVATESLSLKWAPRTWLEVTLTGGLDHRSSTDGYFTYVDRVLGAKLRLIW